jgi:hypothetical protein
MRGRDRRSGVLRLSNGEPSEEPGRFSSEPCGGTHRRNSPEKRPSRTYPARYHVADRMLGPWNTLGNSTVGPDSATTFGAQSTFVLPLQEACDRCFLFMADRWSPRSLQNSSYLWLPFRVVPDGSIQIELRENWDLSTFRHLP